MLLLTTMLMTQAHAYEFWENSFGQPLSWGVPSYTAEVNTASIAVPSGFNDEIVVGVESWDRFSGSRLATSVTTMFDTSLKTSDNHNSVQFVTMMDLNTSPYLNSSLLPCTTLGMTTVRQSLLGIGDEIVEADIVLDTDCTWMAWVGGNQHYDMYSTERSALWEIDLDHVVIHEAGHAVGLDEDDGIPIYDGSDLVDYSGYPTTMEPVLAGGAVLHELDLPWGNTWWNQVVVNENDREAIRALYVPQLGDEDFAVQAYWSDNVTTVLADSLGCSIVYAHKGLARPQPSADLLSVLEDNGFAYGSCPSYWPSGVWVDRPDAMPVQPLAVVEPQFTLLSLGYSGGSVNWEIHLKQDVTDEDCSNSGCYVLGSFTTTVNSNTPYQRVAEEVTIPPVTPGEYYLTAYIDSDDAWSETDETNQTAVWQQKLDVQANSCGCAATGPWAGAPGLLLLVFGLMRRRVHGRGTV